MGEAREKAYSQKEQGHTIQFNFLCLVEYLNYPVEFSHIQYEEL